MSEAQPVTILGGDDLYRNRLLVLLRYILAVPHYIWWGVFRLFIVFAIPINWVFTVALGRQPAILYEFLAGYIRYRNDLVAYLTLLADPYPGFAAVRSYPVEAWVPPSQPGTRLSTLFRPLLILPAVIAVHLAQWVLVGLTVIAVVASFVLGLMPARLQWLGLSLLRFIGETSGYGYLITSSYPSLTPRPGAPF